MTITLQFCAATEALKYYRKALKMAPTIPPKEDEEYVVRQSKLESYLRIASTELEGTDQAIVDGVKIARELDAEKQLQTQYQSYYFQLLRMADERGVAVPDTGNR